MDSNRLDPSTLTFLIVCAFGMGAYVLYHGICEVTSIRRLEQGGRTVIGKVVDKTIDYDPDGPDTCYVTVAYPHLKQSLSTKRMVTDAFCASVEVGHAVNVCYAPEDPTCARLPDGELADLDRNVSYLFIGGFLLLAGAYGVYYKRQRG